MAAPVLTAGPCKPTEPPKPTVIGATINEANILYLSMIPLRLEIAYRVVEIPWPISFFKKFFLIK